MKKTILYISFLLLFTSCSQEVDSEMSHIEHAEFSVSPMIDQHENLKLIKTLKAFLNSKDSLVTYWMEEDMEKYAYQYHFIKNASKSRFGENFYKPRVMELVDLENEEKLVKIGFVGLKEDGSSIIRAIYNMIATRKGDDWKFRSIINYRTRNWKTITRGSIEYVSASELNEEEVNCQLKGIEELCSFFETKPIPFIYYSCESPEEVFRIQGFDYLPIMYISDVGGFVENGNIVFSGNNSTYYQHEVVHVYVNNLYPNTHSFFNEGIATYLGGSGGQNFKWHKSNLLHSEEITTIDFNDYTNIRKGRIINNSQVSYVVAALICQKIIREQGKDFLFANMERENHWEVLNQLGISKENLNEIIIEELKL